MNWQRATTYDKKHQRKEEIYSAALTLFRQKPYDDISFNGIASQAGFTKSNMYRYFSSKEEIFLNIFANLFQEWFDDINQRLQEFEQDVELEPFAQAWVDAYMAYPQFLDLIPLLFLSLENNSSYEQLLEFKHLSMKLLYQLATEIGRVYPSVQGENAFQFLTLSFAATANYWAAESKQNDALIKIYQQEPFIAMKPNFKHNLKISVEVIIRGLLATPTNN